MLDIQTHTDVYNNEINIKIDGIDVIEIDRET